MKLFSFPHVVIYELMKEFKTINLISLSFCSKTAHAVVKTFSKIKKGLAVLPCGWHAYNLTIPGCVSIRVASYIAPHNVKHSFNDSADLYNYCADADQGCRELANYICDLFKIPITFCLITREEELWLLDFAEQRQKQKLERIDTGECHMSAESYSRLLRYTPTEHLDCSAYPPNDYRFEGKLPPNRFLSLCKGFWITREHLISLQSSVAFLGKTKFTSSDINTLLKCWLNGELQNLKYLRLEASNSDQQVYEGISDRLESVQGEITYMCENLSYYDPHPVEFNSNAFHIRRDDNAVATVKFNGPDFVVVVWPDVHGHRV